MRRDIREGSYRPLICRDGDCREFSPDISGLMPGYGPTAASYILCCCRRSNATPHSTLYWSRAPRDVISRAMAHRLRRCRLIATCRRRRPAPTRRCCFEEGMSRVAACRHLFPARSACLYRARFPGQYDIAAQHIGARHAMRMRAPGINNMSGVPNAVDGRFPGARASRAVNTKTFITIDDGIPITASADKPAILLLSYFVLIGSLLRCSLY